VSGLLPPEGDGDGGLFKGILVRYLADLLAADEQRDGRLRAALRRNGEAVSEAVGQPVGADWRHPDGGDSSLSTHLSAVLLLEGLACADPPAEGE
jgi:hypothetical protein